MAPRLNLLHFRVSSQFHPSGFTFMSRPVFFFIFLQFRGTKVVLDTDMRY